MLFLGALVVYINTIDSYVLLTGCSEAARATRLRGPLHFFNQVSSLMYVAYLVGSINRAMYLEEGRALPSFIYLWTAAEAY